MAPANWWVLDTVLPAILLIVLIALVLKTGSSRNSSRNEAGAHEPYGEEEGRRPEGTDKP